MKRLCCLLLCSLLLVGCGNKSGFDRAMALRSSILKASGCRFDATITADYGGSLYVFSVECEAESTGKLAFRVIAPDSIAGITGTVDATGGNLTFDDQVLAFPILPDDVISPVSAPWLFMKTLSGGYLKACEETDNGLHLLINDSYAQEAIRVEVYTDSADRPIRADFFWQGSRILTLEIENFTVL